MDQEQRLLLKNEDFLSEPFHLHLQAGSKMAAAVLGACPDVATVQGRDGQAIACGSNLNHHLIR